MKMNSMMRLLYETRKIHSSQNFSLLSAIGTEQQKIDGFIFLKKFKKQYEGARNLFTTTIEYETFVNSFHVEDYANGDPLCAAFSYAANILWIWASNSCSKEFTVILSNSYFEEELPDHTDKIENVFFKIYAGGESDYLLEDIELYKLDAVCTISSKDIITRLPYTGKWFSIKELLPRCASHEP